MLQFCYVMLCYYIEEVVVEKREGEKVRHPASGLSRGSAVSCANSRKADLAWTSMVSDKTTSGKTSDTNSDSFSWIFVRIKTTHKQFVAGIVAEIVAWSGKKLVFQHQTIKCRNMYGNCIRRHVYGSATSGTARRDLFVVCASRDFLQQQLLVRTGNDHDGDNDNTTHSDDDVNHTNDNAHDHTFSQE